VSPERPGEPARKGLRPRAGLPARGCADEEFDEWLRRITERTDPAMTWLGVVFGLLVAAQFGLPTTATAGRLLADVIWLLWAVFVLDFLLKLWLAPHRLRFLRRHWLTLLGLLAPTLRVLSFLRLLRLGRAAPAVRALTSSSRALRSAGPLFRSRIGYLGGITSLGILLIGELAYVFDNGPHGTMPTLGSALLWSAASVIGMSPTANPTTAGGQLLMIAAFILGMITVSTLAGAIGAYLLHPHPAPPDPSNRPDAQTSSGSP